MYRGIAESLLSKWKPQYNEQGEVLPGHGERSDESTELRRLRLQRVLPHLHGRFEKG